MPSASLLDRTVLTVEGADAASFLERLVTCAVDTLPACAAAFGALLSPQGKILADFVVHRRAADAFLLDAPAAVAADLARRLNLYRLRAKLTVADTRRVIEVGWAGEPAPADALMTAVDPRLPALGWRAVLDPGRASRGEAAAYHAHRVALGIPELGRDAPVGDPFPHEMLMDQLGGVDFRKGCYVGQEVVSRMQHRGTARTRIISVTCESDAPEPGTEVVSGERTLGRLGSAAGRRALAMLRVDRAGEALAAGAPITAAGQPLRFAKPDWVGFPYPGEARR